jgi:hypothetical protein
MAVVGVVAHQLGLHVDPPRHPIGPQVHHLQAQHLVEDDLLFKDGAQPVNELGLERRGGRRGGFTHEDFRQEDGVDPQPVRSVASILIACCAYPASASGHFGLNNAFLPAPSMSPTRHLKARHRPAVG